MARSIISLMMLPGERVCLPAAAIAKAGKGKSTGQSVFVNGELKAGNGSLGNFIVYVNPYLVLKSGGYTKHYYIEGQRIVSKLGGGFDNNAPSAAGNGKVNFENIHKKVFDGIVKNLKFLGADGQILTAGKSGKVPPGQVSGTGNISEALRYFYHPDHLGSTSYITDATGEVYQHLEYFAFGETFVEEHSNTNRTPYLFNGKELDEETGLYYYGARYYGAKTSVFVGVDPADRFPSLTPFQFAGNQGRNAIDLDGLEPVRVNGGVENLVIVVQGYTGVDPKKGATQAAGNPGGIDVGGLGSLNSLTGGNTQVAIFSSSQTSSTQKDVATSIADFNSSNPNGKVILVGHSLGADNLIEMVNNNNNLKVDALITLDIADYYDDDNIPSNVKSAINYYQTNDFPGGEKIEINDPTKTNGQNILAPNSTHRSIDNDLKGTIKNDVLRYSIKPASTGPVIGHHPHQVCHPHQINKTEI